MPSAELWIGIILLLAITLVSTVISAMRQVSRVKLSERFEKQGRPHWLTRLIAHRDEMIFSFAFLRLGSIIGLVMLMDHFVGRDLETVNSPAMEYPLVFGATIVLTMVFGVAIPNTWARYGGAGFLATVMPLLLGLRLVLYPLVVFQRMFDALVRRLAGIQNGGDLLSEEIEKEILVVVSEGELSGAVNEDEADMIESVMEFRDTEVSEIMTPRTEIVALPANASLRDAKELITRHGHSRIPVFEENIDDIKGVLYAKDLLTLEKDSDFDPIRLMRKVPFVPEGKSISDLLQELRDQKVHLAMVLDEYGGTAGLVTIEDIIEEIVGEISDEYEESEPDPIIRVDENVLEVDARVHIDEINEELNIELPEDEDYDTVGGFVFSTLGKIPITGEELDYHNVKLRVIDAEERKINRLRIEVLPNQAPA